MKVGDLVRLKLGGPRGEVSHVYEAAGCNAGKVEVHWNEVRSGRTCHLYEVLSPKLLRAATSM